MVNEKWIRLFQDDKGRVSQIENLTLAGCKCLIDAAGEDSAGNVLLIWLTISHNGGWLRIFIDEICCGIDKYADDESESDYEFDEGFFWKNYDDCVKDSTIEKASVFNDYSSENDFIKLEIMLSNESKINLISDKHGGCRFNIESINL